MPYFHQLCSNNTPHFLINRRQEIAATASVTQEGNPAVDVGNAVQEGSRNESVEQSAVEQHSSAVSAATSVVVLEQSGSAVSAAAPSLVQPPRPSRTPSPVTPTPSPSLRRPERMCPTLQASRLHVWLSVDELVHSRDVLSSDRFEVLPINAKILEANVAFSLEYVRRIGLRRLSSSSTSSTESAKPQTTIEKPPTPDA